MVGLGILTGTNKGRARQAGGSGGEQLQAAPSTPALLLSRSRPSRPASLHALSFYAHLNTKRTYEHPHIVTPRLRARGGLRPGSRDNIGTQVSVRARPSVPFKPRL